MRLWSAYQGVDRGVDFFPALGMKGDVMKSKAIVPLAIGLIVGVFAVTRGLNYIKSVKGSSVAGETVTVVTAKMEIQQGVPISETMFALKEVAKDLAPARHFSDGKEVMERVTSMIIPKDMPILPTMLSPVGTSPGLGAKIPNGMRAVAVKVDEWSGVGGWIKPGVRVDLSAVFSVKEAGGRKNKSISKIILQNIEVAAVGATMGSNPQEPGATVSRSVTLIVKPKDVSRIHLASTKGKVSLAMRSSIDDEHVKVGIEDEDDLLNEGGKSGKKLASAFSGFFQSLWGKDKSEELEIQLAEAPKRCTVLLINGARGERRVYLHDKSMEQVGFEGGKGALLDGKANPYGAGTRLRGSRSTGSSRTYSSVSGSENLSE